MQESLVSIIVPVYNAEKYLDRCINSILIQSYKNFELILIDDRSMDNSREICVNYTEKDNRIHLFENESNRGVSYTRNRGISVAKGLYVTFIDSDDWVDSDYLFDFFSEPIFSNSIVVQGIFYHFPNSKTKPFFHYNNKKYSSNELSNISNHYNLLLNGCPVAKLYSLEIIRQNNIRFNESLSLNEDHLFVFDYYKHVKNVYLKAAEDYHYWFDLTAVSLTKKKHNPQNYVISAENFLSRLPFLIDKFNITDSRNLQKLYTNCGLSQLFEALLSEAGSKRRQSFVETFERLEKYRKLVLKYYKPNSSMYSILKFFFVYGSVSLNYLMFLLFDTCEEIRTLLLDYLRNKII